jgi:hypothetical protein
VQLNTTDDLTMQLQNYGFPVLEIVRVSEIGKAERQVVSFSLPDAGWWGFVARPDGTYRAEPADAPYDLPATTAAPEQIMPLDAVYSALFEDADPASALVILANQLSENPAASLSPAGLMLQALAYELTGSRENARQGYYDVWQRFPESVWGQLAARHLEQR